MKNIRDSASLWLAGPRRRGTGGTAPPANQPPVTVADTATVFAATPTVIAVLANDSDPEGGVLTLVSATASVGTAAVLADGTLRYTPPAGFTGSATVAYVAADAQGAQSPGTLAVTVAGPILALTPNADGTLTVSAASGAVSLGVTSPPEFAGTYVTDAALLSGGPVAIVPPAVTGATVSGSVLTARTGLWIFGGEVTGETWAWRRNGATIAGATAPTYAIGAADEGAELVAVQTLAADGGSRSATSAPLAIPRPFVPSDDTGLVAWYDAALTSTITRTASVVTTWASRAGAGTLAATDGPTSGTRTIAGKNVIDFAGTARISGPVTLPANGNVAFHMALAIDSAASAFAAILSVSATRDFQLDAGSDTAFNGRLNVRNIGDTFGLSGGPFPGFRIISVVFDLTGGGTSRVLVNGAVVGTGAYSTALNASQTLAIMTNRSQNAYVDGAVGELIVTGNLAATADHVAHLARKWGGI